MPSLSTAITSLLTLGTLAIATTAYAAEPLIFCKEQEKCYGVSKASKNDCSTSSSVCAGTAKQDYQKDALALRSQGQLREVGRWFARSTGCDRRNSVTGHEKVRRLPGLGHRRCTDALRRRSHGGGKVPARRRRCAFGYRLENSCGTNGSGCGGRALSPRLRRASGSLSISGRWMMVPPTEPARFYGGSLKPARVLTELAAVWIFANAGRQQRARSSR